MRLLRINLTQGIIAYEELSTVYQHIGGRELTSTMLNDEVPGTCDPLGPKNKLIFAPGYLSGTPLVNTSRLSVGAKSPLTGGIKESNAGGTVAVDLAKLGIKAIIFEGCLPQGETSILKIDADGTATLINAEKYQGCRTYQTAAELKKEYGEDYSVTCIGPAGELQLCSASIQTTDRDGKPCRAAGRGGLGAVMGSKGLKALVINRKGKAANEVADLDRFKKASKKFAKAVKENEFTAEVLPLFGTASTLDLINAIGAFPTCNAKTGHFEHGDKIGGEALSELIKERGGQTTHKGCAKCIINCSNVFVDKKGDYVTSSLEYETIWSMGGMIGNDDLDSIAKLDFLCDDIGLDTMNTGVAIGVAMDAGYKNFGDSEAAIEMVEEIAKGSEFGRVLGNGPDAVGKYFNHDRVPTVKGQSIAAYDPRGIQGMAVTYATSPMGADHTAGLILESMPELGGNVDPLAAAGQVEISRDKQIHVTMIDAMGICDFAQTGLESPDGMSILYQMISARSGRKFRPEDWRLRGEQILKVEREFNRSAGLTSKDDRLPDFFYKEPLPPHNKTVLVSDKDMDRVFDFEKES
jgi:aldehyde:ferredoxin oxidoreductase